MSKKKSYVVAKIKTLVPSFRAAIKGALSDQ